MDTIKKLLPFALVGILVIFLLSRLKQGVKLAPQTQLTQSPNVDPQSQFRLPAFQALAGVATAQTEAETQARTEASGLEGLLASLQNALSIETLRQTTAQQANIFQRDLQSQGQLIGQNLGMRAFDVQAEELPLRNELIKYLNESQQTFNMFALNRYYDERAQDRQIQQSAIDNYYRMRTGGSTGQIIGSISSAIQSIFGGRGNVSGGVFGTPPTFPSFGSGGGIFGGLF